MRRISRCSATKTKTATDKANEMRNILLSFLFFFMGLATAMAQTYEQFVEAALSAASHDSLPEAEVLFRKALKASPSDYRNALVFNNLGKVQEQLYWQNPKSMQKATDALESYTMALSFAPEAVPLLTSRADLYMRLEQYAKAIADLTTILDVAPNRTDIRNRRAYCYAECHRLDEARNDYQRVVDEDSQNRIARLGLALLSQQAGRLAEAIERISQLIGEEQTDAELLSIRSSMYAENHQPELAILDLNRVIELVPDHANYWLARVYLHKSQGSLRQALADFEQAISLGIPRASLRQELKECR